MYLLPHPFKHWGIKNVTEGDDIRRYAYCLLGFTSRVRRSGLAPNLEGITVAAQHRNHTGFPHTRAFLVNN